MVLVSQARPLMGEVEKCTTKFFKLNPQPSDILYPPLFIIKWPNKVKKINLT